MHKNVWILTIAQAFMMSVNSMNVFVGGLIGNQLAPSDKLATLPVASIVVGTAFFTVPISFLMKSIGRKKAFLIIAFYSIAIALLASYAISIRGFYFFSFCTFLLGATSACIMQFRFASMESVSPEKMPKAAAFVLIGGIAAAFIGPEVAILGKELLTIEFSGSFLLLSGLFAIGLLILVFYENVNAKASEQYTEPRSIRTIIKQRVFWVALIGATVGYAVMTLIMTATPISMHVMDGHSLDNTKVVIQSHIVAMFLPSLFTGGLIKRIGVSKIMLVGLIAYLICIAIAFTGHLFTNYWIALILLGIGWNFLFIGGTALLPQSYKESERFKVQAFNDFFLFSSQALASLTAGWVVFSIGWELLLLVTIPFILFQILMISMYRKRSKGIKI